MKYGIAITTSATPVFIEPDQKDYILRISKCSEENGYDSLWVSDRTVYPNNISEIYPQQFGINGTNPNSQNVMESLVTLSFIAAKTQKVLLGTSVLVLPFRNPLLNTKMLSTLDVLSEGRLIVGVGTGWMKEEFNAMGAKFSKRGLITDEHIGLLKSFYQNDVTNYRGDFIDTIGMKMYPRTHLGRPLPIWVGGNSHASIKRAVKFGDAWHGIGLTPNEIKQSVDKINQIADQQGKNPSEITITLRATVKITNKPSDLGDDRPYLTGNISQIADDLQQYKKSGLEYLVISMAADSTDEVLASITEFSDYFVRL